MKHLTKTLPRCPKWLYVRPCVRRPSPGGKKNGDTPPSCIRRTWPSRPHQTGSSLHLSKVSQALPTQWSPQASNYSQATPSRANTRPATDREPTNPTVAHAGTPYKQPTTSSQPARCMRLHDTSTFTPCQPPSPSQPFLGQHPGEPP